MIKTSLILNLHIPTYFPDSQSIVRARYTAYVFFMKRCAQKIVQMYFIYAAIVPSPPHLAVSVSRALRFFQRIYLTLCLPSAFPSRGQGWKGPNVFLMNINIPSVFPAIRRYRKWRSLTFFF